MSDDIEEVSEFEAYEAPPEPPAPRRFPKWALYVGGLILFNVLSQVFDWGWVLW